MLQLFIVFFILKYLIMFFLSILNVTYITKHADSVPADFASKISIEDHRKAASYAKTKAFFAWPFWLVDIALSCFWLLNGGLEGLDASIRSWEFFNTLNPQYKDVVMGLSYFGIFGAIHMLLDLPESLLSTFYVESKFGFNRTTPKTFFLDFIKQLILSLVLGVPLLASILTIMQYLGDMWWIYAIIFFISFQILLLFIFPTWIAPLFNTFTPLEDGEMKEKIVQLLKRIEFPFKELFVMDASMRSAHGNAYFTGFGKNKRIVFFDTLLKSLTPDEVVSVLAHELGHFKLKHILKSMILSFTFISIGIYFISILLKAPWFYSTFGIQNPSHYMALILFSMVIPYFSFFMAPLMAYFSRRNEYQADTYACENANGFDLINGLIKMYKDNASTLTPHPLFVRFYHSHPAALDRIAFIRKLCTPKDNP